MGRSRVSCTALPSLSLAKPKSPELSPPSGWLWTEEWKAPFKAERWYSNPKRMSLETSIINRLPLRRVPSLRVVQSKPMEPMGSSPIELAKSHLGKSATLRKPPDPFRGFSTKDGRLNWLAVIG